MQYTDLSMDGLQAKTMNERLIEVSADDIETGCVSKLHAHRATGVLHRAFSVLLFNLKGELLIQKRSACKTTFPEYWANSCCSHPLYTKAEREQSNSAGVKRAAIRKLSHELGIADTFALSDFTVMTRLHYRAESCAGWVEEEVDHILIAQADVVLLPNPNEVLEVKWVTREALADWLSDRTILIAPWFRFIAGHLLPGWWSHLHDTNALQRLADDRIIRLDQTNA